MIIPAKLKEGDGVRVVAPAKSMALPFITGELKETAKKRFKELGLVLSFGKHVNEKNSFESSSVESRVEDLHDAFKDPSIKMILAVIGGFNSIEVLPALDYTLIRKNPKIVLGYSDITALSNGIYARTGLVSYSGPSFFDFGEKKNFEYSLDHFKKCLFERAPYKIHSSKQWSNDRWANDQEHRTYVPNEGMYALNEGEAKGTIVGGNLVTFHALSGTPYMPSLRNSILFFEDDHDEDVLTINRALSSISLNPEFEYVQGVVFGRFQPESKFGEPELRSIIKNNPLLQEIPIIAGADFGHTSPRITFPVGGTARFSGSKNKVELEILKH